MHESLQDQLRWKNEKNSFFVMAHRNSPIAGFAENDIATLQQTKAILPCAVQEIDVRMTKDSVLVLLHDSTLDRTTTGSGNLNLLNYNEVKKLFLKDDYGKILKNSIPTLLDFLRVAKKNSVNLFLDMKPGTDSNKMMDVVRQTNMQSNVIVICYTIKSAQKLHKEYPTLMLSLGFNSWEDISKIEKSGINFKNLVALTPQKLQEKSFYKKIHEMGIITSFGTNGGIDTLKNELAIIRYKDLIEAGIDMICTDSAKKVLNILN
ncbi:glycerophosphodiester phosphodiesterase family protein [Pedobacter nototheniae]|uniref:glycerophosphodiester phosphodiesterase family protein n=1 Tax=Pedobacter nototheniae TaxID=2488994 RepID=UPI0013F41743|nr:glycerophosphodiester phosphodiesterase family protein [Pedobacter nototheniae]